MRNLLLLLLIPNIAFASTVIEFYNAELDHYFITGSSKEAAIIDRGAAGHGWVRTGNTFEANGNHPVARFYGNAKLGPNSHYYTADSNETLNLRTIQSVTPNTEKRWNYEGATFAVNLPVNGACLNNDVPIFRAYNNGFARGIDSNHRIATNLAAINEVVARGWIYEGVVMCASSTKRPDHVVVVLEENRSYSQIMHQLGNSSYIKELMSRGVLFTQSYGVTHPSQPNYLALFSGSTHGVTNDDCPFTFNTDNLATSLLDKGITFASFSESLPSVGDTSCSYGAYYRKHNPAANWQGTRLPPEVNKRFADFPQDFTKLPTVSFVIPDQNNDMHDGSIEAADDWLRKHIAPYVEWAYKNNSLLVLTWDEDDYYENNRIVTIMVGPMVKPGISGQPINHYSVLRTLLDFYELPPIGHSHEVEAIKNVWR